ncbi:kinase-like protein [Neocallimastix californiae]|jgi:serine/threonine protein kinase|uniref:dual-specificity kinase n=1 Tax=Neocallimastix californiae TaxID=1754190 RepID=A0A1Y2AH47_9FUNG|nr:kinase-like protein [Neocallimastix californiae]|eukprot:ORY21918.1 kinase-like protein [Neocallimastix californiae]
MNVAYDDAMLLHPKKSSYVKNEKYYSFNNLNKKSIKSGEEEAKNINRMKSLSTSSYSLKPETLKSLSLDKVSEEEPGNLTVDTKLKHDKSNEQISIFQMDREDKQPMTAIEPTMANLNTKLCMTPETVLRTKYDVLTSYERVEIRDYDEIWYIGSNSVQKIDIAYKKPTEKKHGEKPEVLNNGYDDSRGDYHIILHDHINYRYEIISLLGKGSFGKVLKCYDHKEKNYVAVKIIKNKKRFEKQGMVEVKVLDAIKSDDPENVMNSYNIKYIESFYFRGHLCIVNELLGINLYEWIKNGGFRGVTISMIRHITKEVLTSLEVLEQKKIVHCDLKPENILLRDPMQIKPSLSSSDLDKIGIKVIDFGSSCYENERIYTYVQSRFYRSPEVILGIPYNMSIDMWSLGCILAELYTGYPIFPGESEEEQLACIMEVMGAPEPYIVDKGSRKKNFFESNGTPKLFTNSKGKKRRPGSISLATVLRCRDSSFIDFITQCLQWDPEKRMTPSQGLKHEFITKLNKKVSSDNTTASIANITNKPISTNSSLSTYSNGTNSNLKKPKVSTPNSSIGLNRSSLSKTDKSVSPLIQGEREIKTFSGIKHSSTQINNIGNNISRSSIVKNNTINAYSSGRKSSGSGLSKVSTTINNDDHNIQMRKSTSNLVNYGDANTNNVSKVAKIIAAAEQKTLSSGKIYAKKDSSLAIETIKNVRRPSVKEIALAKDNIERANAIINMKKSHSREGATSASKANSSLDYKFSKAKPKHNLSINVSQLGVSTSTQSKSAYPKLSSGFFGSTNREASNDSNESNDIPKPRKFSLLSKSLNQNVDILNNRIKTLPNESKTGNNETEKLEFNKIDISNNNKNNVSSLRNLGSNSLKRSSSSSNMQLNSIENLRKTFSNEITSNLISSNLSNVSSNNTKYSSSIPTSTVKPINNNTNSSMIGNNSSYSSTISSSSSSTLVNDDTYDTPNSQQSYTINSLSLLSQEAPIVKSRPRTYSHSVYSTNQGQNSSIPRLASIYKNSSNNIMKTINKFNSNIENHNNSITKERDRDFSNTIKTTGLVTKRKSAFSLKAKAAQAAQSTTTTNTQSKWKI